MLTVAPLPPEKIAYALARYSRSPDSIQQSLEWVRTHDSSKFLESFYFQYGHASIADLGHLVVCFEGISELAATEIEDEQLWDGQARSSRYQDFSRGELIVPAEFDSQAADTYRSAGTRMIEAYRKLQAGMVEYLSDRLPRPESMKPEAYQRNIAARAFDVSRYCLFFGVPTGVGQVVSIRTLERQIRRLRASEYAEVRDLGEECASACAAAPQCGLPGYPSEPLAPTLARHVKPDTYGASARADLRSWLQQNMPEACSAPQIAPHCTDVQLTAPEHCLADIAATLLYSVSTMSFADLYTRMLDRGDSLCAEIVETATRSRSSREELLREFRTAPYAFDMLIDTGAYRDLHRHRRCQQFRQEYGTLHGFETPRAVHEAGLVETYSAAMEEAYTTVEALPAKGREYLLPFATRSRFLFKMDFAEAEYIIRLRTGVKGHFSYREIAWRMKQELEKMEPALGKLLGGTPPSVEDPLTR